MFNGKNKALTFSFDDGVEQDKRLIEILNRYNLKSTFNINSEFLGRPGRLERETYSVDHNKIAKEEVLEVYKNHELAAHTLTHPLLTTLSDEEIIRQVEEDRKNIEELSCYDVIGMAYPCGGENNDDRVAQIIKNNTKIKYARTITSTHNFDLQDNLYRFNPTVHVVKWDKLFELGEEFLKLETVEDKLFYVWGHSYEFDIDSSWEKLEEFCKMMSGKDDIFYGTNRQVLL